MSMRWTMEAVVASAALVVGTCGTVYNGVYRAGQVDTQVRSISEHQKEQDVKIDQSQQLGTRVDQKLDDAISRLGRIEDKIDKR